MFVIYSQTSNMYVHTKGKVVTFETIDEANQFLQGFNQYCIARGIREDPIGIQDIISFFNGVQIEPFTDSFKCESITWKEYKDSKKKNNG